MGMKSFLPVGKQETELLDFHGAIDAILENKRVTREEWNDKRWYCLLKDDMLQIHKPGEAKDALHPWTVSNGDLGGLDWYVL